MHMSMAKNGPISAEKPTNVAVGSPAVDHRVGVRYRPPRRLRLPKPIAFGSSSDLVGNDHGLEDLAKLLEVTAELLRRGLPCQLKEKKKKMRRRKPYIPTLLLFARHRESEEDLTRLSLFTKYGRSTVLTSEFLLFSAPHFAFFGDLSSFHDPCRERRRAEW
ncbi:hypothetical protein BHM03_00000856 [Ensete ventricosum]|uniref:Uncharacterized protein n=1 Tax=Ensete ventricosum TaxID=4639 RepID=A0A445M8P9_ENSVE|nr:hypothetical protein BHM03_00000856 [Ensete ventricosum]